MKKIGIVLTTISDGNCLYKYTEAASHASNLYTIIFYVVGDKNTPAACKENCGRIHKEFYPCIYLSVNEQEDFLTKINFPKSYIPYKSDNRRNVGYLKALEEKCDVVISIDDDNFPVDKNFFIYHGAVGNTVEATSTHTDNKWFNPMSLLRSKSKAGEDIHIYPRGFPYEKKWKDNSNIDASLKLTGKIGVNVGLWTGDPDVDAITRLTTGCYSEPEKNWNEKELFALGQNHLMPINTQNTSLLGEAIVSYYFVKMGYSINNITMDRFGDIFSGYFLLLCNQSVGNMVTLGNPLVFQDRNEHNLFKDLQVELPCILVIEDLAPFLETSFPSIGSYADAYLYLIEKLREFTSSNKKSSLWSKENLIFINEITQIMLAWRNSCELLK